MDDDAKTQVLFEFHKNIGISVLLRFKSVQETMISPKTPGIAVIRTHTKFFEHREWTLYVSDFPTN